MLQHKRDRRYMSYFEIVGSYGPPGSGFYDQNWFYGYRYLGDWFSDDELMNYVVSQRSKISPLTKRWDNNKNTEWVVRQYLSVKMIFSATVMLNSCSYAYDRNIRIVESYLNYYALLSCFRSAIYSNHLTEWRDGSLINMAHSKIINIGCDLVSKISQESGSKLKGFIQDLKALREVISYGAPSNGMMAAEVVDEFTFQDVVDACGLMCEVAQLNSEILERSIAKNYRGDFKIISEKIDKCFVYHLNGSEYYDNEDAYRLGYFIRKSPYPNNLLCSVPEGQVDDVFGAWYPESDDIENEFNPDEDCRLLFDFP